MGFWCVSWNYSVHNRNISSIINIAFVAVDEFYNMKAAIYVRVSTQDQSLEAQKESCIQYCDRMNLEHVIFEEKISGAKASRPELDKMLQRVRAGEFDSVVVHKLDRLGRSTIHLIQLIEEFRNKNVQFISVTQGINTKEADI